MPHTPQRWLHPLRKSNDSIDFKAKFRIGTLKACPKLIASIARLKVVVVWVKFSD